MDTRQTCARVVRTRDLRAEVLAEAALALAEEEHGADLILGGGLDAQPELLRLLGDRFHLLGNGPKVAAALADPQHCWAMDRKWQRPWPTRNTGSASWIDWVSPIRR
jgi:hypothetical protein